MGAAAVRFSAECATRHCAAADADDEFCAGTHAEAFSWRAGAARMPDHRQFRRLPDHRPVAHAGTGATARMPPGREHGTDVPSRLLRGGAARRTNAIEREPRTGI